MKIGLLIYDLRSGGAERVLCKWSEMLAQDHDVIMYNFDDASAPEYEFSGKLKILKAPSRGKSYISKLITALKRYALLKKQVRKDKIDVLISFCSTANFPAMLQRIPRIASIRVFSEYDEFRRIYRFMIKHTRTRLLVQTERLRHYILNDVGEEYAGKICVLGNPVDVESIRRKALEQPDDLFLKMIENRKVICFAGSFKTQKNHCNLIKSFKLLNDKHPETLLALIGADGDAETEVRKMVSDSGLKDDVLILGKKQNPFCYESASDLFVLPSLYEGIPNALIEALIVGVPVISTDCPSGPREVLYKEPDISKHTKDVEYADFGILVSEFGKTQDFDMENVSEQNIFLRNAMEQMLFDESVIKRYTNILPLILGRYDMTAYSNNLKSIVEQTSVTVEK